MISRDRIEQLRYARVAWQDVDDLIAALDEREEIIGKLLCHLPNEDDRCEGCPAVIERAEVVLRGGRFEVK